MAQSHQGSLWGTSVGQEGGIEGPEEGRCREPSISSPAGGLSPSPGEVRAGWGREEMETQEASDNKTGQTSR